MGAEQSSPRKPDWEKAGATQRRECNEKRARDLMKALTFDDDDEAFRGATLESVKKWEERLLTEPKVHGIRPYRPGKK
ncbi:hypothetical protein ABW19_dt0205038 [Dactylella cylindrospora]|nr:hypothetical protein ABW19_dt0205038 [Dactylella cylindrospora]